MDLDLALVRAFVASAGTLHFGRAAEALDTSQQALSKRIARLEESVGVRLFERRGGIRLSAAGERFLLAAHEALAAVTGAGPVVRIDTWGHLYAPMRTVAAAVQELDTVRWEPGPGRDWPSVAQALQRGDADLGFGRVHPLPDGRDAGLTQRLVRLEPVDVVVGPSHPAADADALRPGDLHDSVLWCPAELNRLDFLRCIPLVEPTPLYAWSLAWRESSRHPLLDTLLRGFAEMGRTRRWLEYDPGRDWLPDTDRPKLTPRQSADA
ncbi:LysR family transcriptional regulator [Streptomyces sp. SID8381]|uniref:LysR family transcriptional regulator n=1 Tax=unclassified Streptomyces TaxID=2593676 RepID=UPI00035DDB51|nr:MULTISPECIES: LysR family transcriptional regulator [unclassified Streptomyces]MYX31068.1 LysR family transcriptional regulator [Streptomyces sp. SID8381]